MHVSYLPRAVAAGARVRAGVEARRVVFERGRAVAVGCRSGVASGGRGQPFTVRARRGVVLSGGAFGTPELLLRSGFRSPSGALGRNLRVHPACWVGARFDQEVRGWDGVMQSYAVDEWERMGILLEATFTPLAFGGQWLPGVGAEHQERLLAFGNIASTGVHLSDKSSGRVGLGRDGSLRISYRLNKDDRDRLVFGIARAAELLYAAGAREVYPQISGLPIIDRGDIASLEASPPRRAALRLEAFHPMGTARMDADPQRGVDRHRRGRARREGSLRRRRLAAAELDRGQPDDDDHRDVIPGRRPDRRGADVEAPPPAAASRSPLLPAPEPDTSSQAAGPCGGGGPPRPERSCSWPAWSPNEVPSSCIARQPP